MTQSIYFSFFWSNISKLICISLSQDTKSEREGERKCERERERIGNKKKSKVLKWVKIFFVFFLTTTATTTKALISATVRVPW